jgi:hypothetical protein
VTVVAISRLQSNTYNRDGITIQIVQSRRWLIAS